MGWPQPTVRIGPRYRRWYIKMRLFDEFVQTPPADVDVLLVEGTNIRPGAEPAPGKTEREVEQERSLPVVQVAIQPSPVRATQLGVQRVCLQSTPRHRCDTERLRGRTDAEPVSIQCVAGTGGGGLAARPGVQMTRRGRCDD